MFFQFCQGDRRSSVAGDNNRFCIFLHQHFSNLEAIAFYCAGAFSAVGNACRVAEIEYFFARQEIAQRLHDGETANAGIEDADWSRIAHSAGKVAVQLE